MNTINQANGKSNFGKCDSNSSDVGHSEYNSCISGEESDESSKSNFIKKSTSREDLLKKCNNIGADATRTNTPYKLALNISHANDEKTPINPVAMLNNAVLHEFQNQPGNRYLCPSNNNRNQNIGSGKSDGPVTNLTLKIQNEVSLNSTLQCESLNVGGTSFNIPNGISSYDSVRNRKHKSRSVSRRRTSSQTRLETGKPLMSVLPKLPYKERTNLETRLQESTQIKQSHPGKLPVIIERHKKEKVLPVLVKFKFLVPTELTISHLVSILRNRISISSIQTLYLLVGDGKTMCNMSCPLGQLYTKYQESDGFLYLTYASQEFYG